MAKRVVFCKKLGKEAEGLDKPPFADQLGEEIFNNVSQEAWDIWTNQMMVRVINEYRLNLAEEEQHAVFIKEMRNFFNLSDSASK